MSTLDHAFIRAYKAGVTAGVKGQPAVRIAELGSGVRETTTDPTATATAVAVSHAPVEDAGQDNTAAMTKPPRPHFFRAAAKPTISNSLVPPPHFSLESFTHTVTSLDAVAEESPISAATAVSVRIDPPQALSPARANFGNVGNGLRAVPLESRLQPAANSLKAGLQPARNAAEPVRNSLQRSMRNRRVPSRNRLSRTGQQPVLRSRSIGLPGRRFAISGFGARRSRSISLFRGCLPRRRWGERSSRSLVRRAAKDARR